MCASIRWMTAAALLPAVLGGCASRLRVSEADFRNGGAEIPTGRWHGWGTYVESVTTVAGGDDAVSQIRTKRGVYETSLTITKEMLFGHEAAVFDIRSKRGKLLSLGGNEETHIRMALVKLPNLEDGRTVYAVAESKYNAKTTNTWNEKNFRKQAQRASASCVQAGATCVLQVHYVIPDGGGAPGFVDTFQFRGDRLVKTGSIANSETNDQDDGTRTRSTVQIDWVEHLTRAGR